MGKKEKLHKRCHTSKKNKNKLDTSKSRSRHNSRPRPKARPDSSDSFSMGALIMNISNIAIASGMVISILDLTLVLKKAMLRNISE